MKTVYVTLYPVKLTKGEIEMLLLGSKRAMRVDSEILISGMFNDGDTEGGGFSKKQRKDMSSAYKVLSDVLNS